METVINLRKEKGRQLAAMKAIKAKSPALWLVPSQTHGGSYLVEMVKEHPTCTCPDHASSMDRCKHIYAVEITLGAEAVDDTPIILVRKTYSQNWPAYNLAQMQEKAHFQAILRTLCDRISQPKYEGRGRPPLPISDVIFAAALKVYSGFSGRRATTDIEEAKKAGYVAEAAHYNSISGYLNRADLTPILKGLIMKAGLALAPFEDQFATDSTGFGTLVYDRWYDQKYGRERPRARFLKAHVTCGVNTQVVSNINITRGNGADSSEFAPLLGGALTRSASGRH